VFVQADATGIRPVFSNLLEKAGCIHRLSVAGSGRRELDYSRSPCSVATTCRGSRTGELERVFERFVRGGTSVQGTGLGLHICRQIVESHHGRIRAESAAFSGRQPSPPAAVGVGHECRDSRDPRRRLRSATTCRRVSSSPLRTRRPLPPHGPGHVCVVGVGEDHHRPPPSAPCATRRATSAPLGPGGLDSRPRATSGSAPVTARRRLAVHGATDYVMALQTQVVQTRSRAS